MNKRLIRLPCVLIGLSLLLAACNFPGAAPASDTPDLQALVAATQTALAAVGTETPTNGSVPAETTPAPGSEQASLTPVPSDTPLPPTATQTSVPATETQQPDCTDAARFESETIPDMSPFQPGETFTKIWRLRNVGTCPWNNGYRVVFFEGDQMGGAEEAYLTANVRPDELVEIRAELTAPAQPGNYRGSWKLRNSAGQEFGLGSSATAPFWVEIAVTSAGESIDLGTPDWLDSFDANLNRWYLGQDSDFQFQILDGALVMTAFSPGGDQWRVAELPPLDDFYLETRFTTGESCSGKDSYGLLLRAPDSPSNIIDTGYVFGFACDGNYRYYRMDGGTYVGLQNWTQSAELKAGPEQTNTIGIRAEGETFTIYINGTSITEFNDGSYSQGSFGLMIRSNETEDLQVLVEEMAYWNLP
jgi:chitodextrinase